MASIIIFSTLWGLALHEWRGASRRALRLLALSLAILVGSTVIIGYGNYLTVPDQPRATQTARRTSIYARPVH